MRSPRPYGPRDALIVGAFFFSDVFQQRPDDRNAAGWLERLMGYGVNTIVTESEDYDTEWITLVHGMGLRWFASISCFSDHANQNRALREHPELWPITATGERRPPMEWYVGITPTYEDYAQSRVRLITHLAERYAFDGLMLDFIRWPVHWELECRPGARPLQASFDPHTLRRFEEFSGVAIPEGTVSQKAAWILSQAAVPWTNFKCHVITSFVADAARALRETRPSMELGVFVLPLDTGALEALAGQRLSDLVPLVDYIAPMAYHAMLHQPAGWAERTVRQAAEAAPGVMLPVLQVDAREGPARGADWGPAIPASEWEDLVRRVLAVPGVCGCVAFTGTALEFENRGRLMRRAVNDITQP